MKSREEARILLVGSRVDRKPVEQALRQLNVGIEKGEESQIAEELRTLKPEAVVWVEPQPNASTARNCESWSSRLRRLRAPLFLVVSSDIDEGKVRQLYSKGVTAVFEWPREREVLPEFLCQMMRLETPGSPGDENTALAEAIRLRIESDEPGQPGYARQIRITTSDGVASLKGIIDSLWEKQGIEEIVAGTPGVKSVRSWGLIVKPRVSPVSKLKDGAIARGVSAAIQIYFPGLPVEVSVFNGQVVLSGTVDAVNRKNQIEILAAQQRGVSRIINKIKVTPAVEGGPAE
jgi:hypothetical protein